MTEDQLNTFHRNDAFVQALIEHQVDFLIVGGTAVKFYRCREVANDLDIMIDSMNDNIQKILDAIHDLKLNVTWSTEQISKPNVQIPLKRDFNLDVLTPPDGVDYNSLKKHSLTASLNGMPVNVVSRGDLIRLKLIAFTRQETDLDKHQRDLERLSAE